MSEESLVHILKKADYGEQHFVSIPTGPDAYPPLAPSSIRVKVKLIALTANNVSYAALGDVMRWWYNFPVPASAPAPLNDRETYGTLPAWGFAEVLESTATSVPVGALVYGYQPVSRAPYDMQVQPAGIPADQFTDVSEHRSTQLPIYTRYVTLPLKNFASLPQDKVEELAWTAILRPLWQSCYLINRYVFADGTHEPVHPSAAPGTEEAAAWTPARADLSRSLIVHFAASSKTAMSLAHELKATRRPGSGPLGLMAVTAAAGLKVLEGAPFATRIVPYADVAAEDTLAWIAGLGPPERVVAFDYGGREGTPARFAEALASKFPDVELLQFMIGAEAKVHRPGKLRGLLPSMLRSNPSAQRDAIIRNIGAEKLAADVDACWRKALTDGDLTAGGLRIGEGLKGDDGVEGAWKKLTGGDFGSQVSMAFKL